MDSVTHAFFVAAVLAYLGHPELILFGVMGAVLMDSDILYSRISDHFPSLYVFTHGGFTHSLAGALVTGGATSAGICLTASTGMIPALILSEIPPAAFAAVFLGSFTHVALDLLAYPGIPVFYPVTDRKYTLGVFAGPSPVMMVVSWVYLILLILGVAPLSALPVWSALFILVVAFFSVLKIAMAFHLEGESIPTFNPLVWYEIRETDEAFIFRCISLLRGTCGEKEFVKSRDVPSRDVALSSGDPEVKRLRYYSYFTTAEREGDAIVIRDPLRDEGIIFYPPSYKKIRIEKNGGRDEW
ncbi:inner membrane protein [Methanolinea mesophila]|uniref:metal-dependent hydrolase n=1 Tax=Methanolinea mesophila TaxID=547055 RepID=UPI001AE2421C|nr:inner membrane protein [Methanolinea mesophila]